jgi:hypothetical protein
VVAQAASPRALPAAPHDPAQQHIHIKKSPPPAAAASVADREGEEEDYFDDED